jgi:uncharacterized protein with FMN-binding domain
MKKLLRIFVIVFLSVIVLFICFGVYMMQGQKEILNTKINDIDLSSINDGIYIGKFNGHRWSNTVEVTVKDHIITNIEFTKGQVFRVREVEDELIDKVISNQSLNVDTVSGGTVSSKAILKAIENAFKK